MVSIFYIIATNLTAYPIRSQSISRFTFWCDKTFTTQYLIYRCKNGNEYIWDIRIWYGMSHSYKFTANLIWEHRSHSYADVSLQNFIKNV